MPALGAGHASLKWVTSFPGNPAQGLPTVMGVLLLSDASNGRLVAVLDAAAVTALRTGAAAVLAAETLGRPGTAAVVGAGVNGKAAARTFVARGQDVLLWDVDQARAEAVAEELGARVAASREEALAADRVVTVTPGNEVLFGEGSLQAGPARLADGRRRAGQGGDRRRRDRARARLLRRLGAGEPRRRTRRGGRGRRRSRASDVTTLGAVLAGDAPGRTRRRATSRCSTRPGSRSRTSRSRSPRSSGSARSTCRRCPL